MEAVDTSAAAMIALAAGSIDTQRELKQYLSHHIERLAVDYDLVCEGCAIGKRILEIGAYPYFLTKALLDAGHAITTVDIDGCDTRTTASAANIPALFCDIETQPLPFPDGAFDEVLLNEVFEHLRINLIFTLSEIRRVLRPGGRLWLSTPNLRSLRGLYNILWRGEAWSSMGQGLHYMYALLEAGFGAGHIREYTSVEVKRFLEATGFVVDKVLYRGTYKSKFAELVCRVAPQYRPAFSLIARPGPTFALNATAVRQ
jgi:SAM-dependent methyltransferase